MADATRLYIRATGATNPTEQKFDIYHDVNGAPTRVNLCGFSNFGEVAGASLSALAQEIKAIDLRADGEPAPDPRPRPPHYSLTFDAYLDKLRGARVNFVRTFAFGPGGSRVYPFTGSPERRFNLHQIRPAYVARLREFVEKARARGIVVCVSFFHSQSLNEDGFPGSPFNLQRNNNDVIRTSLGRPALIGNNEFCNIERPPGQSPAYDPGWTQPQKLWWIQHNLVQAIVSATKDYWNVAYEIMNEPHANIAHVARWHREVATWLKDLLWEPEQNRRSRLVFVNAADNILRELVLGLLPAGQPPLFDVFSFHGGGGDLPSQWGGPHGRSRELVCRDPTPPTVNDIVNGAFGHRGILDAIERFQARPVALFFDTDAHYWAQRNVTPYVEEVLRVDGSYAYRWSHTFLNATSDANCADLQPPRLGLDQQLAKIAAARNSGRITVFAA